MVVTGEGGEEGAFIGMLGQGLVTPGWADDPMRMQDGRRQWGRWDIRRQEGIAGRVNKCM